MNGVLTVMFLFSASALAAAQAEEWLGLNEKMYMDVKSASRRGDIGSIVLRMGSQRDVVEFDCVREVILFRDKDEPMSKYRDLQPAFNAACKRWYEIWK